MRKIPSAACHSEMIDFQRAIMPRSKEKMMYPNSSRAQAQSVAQSIQQLTGEQNAPAPVNPSCFGTLEDAAHNVAGLADRIERIVNRLAGSYPQPGEPASDKPPIDGLLDEATARALNIKANVGAMHAALDRLEKSLP